MGSLTGALLLDDASALLAPDDAADGSSEEVASTDGVSDDDASDDDAEASELSSAVGSGRSRGKGTGASAALLLEASTALSEDDELSKDTSACAELADNSDGLCNGTGASCAWLVRAKAAAAVAASAMRGRRMAR